MGQYWNLQEIGFMIFTIVLRQNLGFYRLIFTAVYRLIDWNVLYISSPCAGINNMCKWFGIIT